MECGTQSEANWVCLGLWCQLVGKDWVWFSVGAVGLHEMFFFVLVSVCFGHCTECEAVKAAFKNSQLY